MIIISRQLHSESTDTFPPPCSYFWHSSAVPDRSLTKGRLARTLSRWLSENTLPVGAANRMNARFTLTPCRLAPSSQPLGAPGRPFQRRVSRCSCPHWHRATKRPLLLTARTPCSFIHPPPSGPSSHCFRCSFHLTLPSQVWWGIRTPIFGSPWLWCSLQLWHTFPSPRGRDLGEGWGPDTALEQVFSLCSPKQSALSFCSLHLQDPLFFF